RHRESTWSCCAPPRIPIWRRAGGGLARIQNCKGGWLSKRHNDKAGHDHPWPSRFANVSASRLPEWLLAGSESLGSGPVWCPASDPKRTTAYQANRVEATANDYDTIGAGLRVCSPMRG